MSEIKPAIMPEIPKNLKNNKAYVNWHSTFIAPLFPEPEPKPKKPKVNKTLKNVNKTLKNVSKNNKPDFNKVLNNFIVGRI
jgi:Zn-dependent oligopeptidase